MVVVVVVIMYSNVGKILNIKIWQSNSSDFLLLVKNIDFCDWESVVFWILILDLDW